MYSNSNFENYTSSTKIKKCALIIGSLPSYAPFLLPYIEKLQNLGVQYDIICWNRLGHSYTETESNIIMYKQKTANEHSSLVRLKELFSFIRFCKKQISKNGYERLFVFTLSTGLLLQPYLSKYYRNKYIFDIRDYSPLLRIPFAHNVLAKLLKNSYGNVISSNGFKHWLPLEYKYIVAHNTNNRELFDQTLFKPINEPYIVLTIGALRDFEANKQVILSLKNDSRFQLIFAGDGIAYKPLLDFVNTQKINNVSFTGRYLKDEELDIVKKCDFINVFLPLDKLSCHLMTNRFYLAVNNRKPMIINEGCFQAEIARKYNLGVIIKDRQNLKSELLDYMKEFNQKNFEEGCLDFTSFVLKEQGVFESLIEDFIKDIYE